MNIGGMLQFSKRKFHQHNEKSKQFECDSCQNYKFRDNTALFQNRLEVYKRGYLSTNCSSGMMVQWTHGIQGKSQGDLAMLRYR
jgi:hypothetical protein